MSVFTTGAILHPVETDGDDDEADTFIGALGRSWSKEWTLSRSEKRIRRLWPSVVCGIGVVICLVIILIALSSHNGGDQHAAWPSHEKHASSQAKPFDHTALKVPIAHDEPFDIAHALPPTPASKAVVHSLARRRSPPTAVRRRHATLTTAGSAHGEARAGGAPAKVANTKARAGQTRAGETAQDRLEQRQYDRFLQRQHGPRHTLHDTLLRIQRREARKSRPSAGFKGDRDFARDFSHYLDSEHPARRTLHGKGLHPDRLRAAVTGPSRGDGFARWLDNEHPPLKGADSKQARRPSESRARSGDSENDSDNDSDNDSENHSENDSDRTGTDGHYGPGWYRTHNLHTSLHDRPSESSHSSPPPRRGPREVAGGRERGRRGRAEGGSEREDSEREDSERDDSESEHEAAERAAERREEARPRFRDLHEKEEAIESRKGNYAGLPPQLRVAREAYDALQHARTERARTRLALRTLHRAVQSVRSSQESHASHPTAHASGWNLDSFAENSGGVLTEVPEDANLARGSLASVPGDSNVGGSLAKIDDSENGGTYGARNRDGSLSQVN